MKFIRFEESRPCDVREMLEKAPIAYVPLGALEWHGEHAPLGLDGLKAHAICEITAEKTGGIVLPTIFWGAGDTMPFPFTFHFDNKNLRTLVRKTLSQLNDWGFRAIVMLSGHYPPSQIRMLKNECRAFTQKTGTPALGVPEQAFACDIGYYGDHAAMWETSIMMAISPELVDLSALPRGLSASERLERLGIMGKDPATHASAEKGRAAIEHIANNLAAAVQRALSEQNSIAFEEIYAEYEKALKIFSPNVFRLIRDALDVHSPLEFLKYAIKSAKLSLRK